MAHSASYANAQAVRDLVPTLHASIYPDIDPSLVKLPQPYVVCIIGGSGAVGGGFARAYARAGATGIILAARTLPALDLVAQEIRAINPSTKTVTVECDITSEPSVAAAAASAKAEFDGRLDVVVINSGYSGNISLDVTQESPEDFRRAYEVHALGTFYTAHYFIPLLLDTPSGAMSFIAIGSISATTVAGPISHVHYCSSKMAQARIIEMVKEQHADRGLFCATVHPGGVASQFSRTVVPQYMHMMTDDQDLAGSFCVWLTKDKDKVDIFNGRFLSCKWDVKELLAKGDEIKAKDLLKFRVAV